MATVGGGLSPLQHQQTDEEEEEVAGDEEQAKFGGGSLEGGVVAEGRSEAGGLLIVTAHCDCAIRFEVGFQS